MDKNRDDVMIGNGEVAFVICADPLAKAEFFDTAVSSARGDVIYVDFDLMYSGYVASGLVPERKGVNIVVPERKNVRRVITSAIERASQGGCLVVIDSLNGIYRICGRDDEMAVNSALMMLASFARQSGSSVLVSCTAVHDSEYGWSLSPVGGRLVNLGTAASRLYVKPARNGIEIEALRHANTPPKLDLA